MLNYIDLDTVYLVSKYRMLPKSQINTMRYC